MRLLTHHDQSGILVFRIAKLKSLKQVRNACKHNRRLIPKESEAGFHISPVKTSLNYSLKPLSTVDSVMHRISDLTDAYEKNVGKKLQSNAVCVIEVIFSLPPSWVGHDSTQFFKDCMKWAEGEFDLAEIVFADVHLDESCPHMHLLICCIRPDQLTASKMCGDRRAYRMRSERFFSEVGFRYGLELPPPRLRKAERIELSKAILHGMEHQNDPATRSLIYPAIKAQIQHNPIPYAVSLGLDMRGKRLNAPASKLDAGSAGAGSPTNS